MNLKVEDIENPPGFITHTLVSSDETPRRAKVTRYTTGYGVSFQNNERAVPVFHNMPSYTKQRALKAAKMFVREGVEEGAP